MPASENHLTEVVILGRLYAYINQFSEIDILRCPSLKVAINIDDHSKSMSPKNDS
jgi:hypothetical protein